MQNDDNDDADDHDDDHKEDYDNDDRETEDCVVNGSHIAALHQWVTEEGSNGLSCTNHVKDNLGKRLLFKDLLVHQSTA
ncbi:hypothetical protein PoB_001511600 [Plakobranchus ocellatus]|uniref:Uncharacterized protein n=1 Tax=Plakobranchus ocellatus TaxID=259542 RepID=A0AAV3YMY4_9GAST|nr:hypothetical protein PoB_001511600 [Plakobranchus ocellatus]